ncbi:MAG: hypothetical protein G01um101438_782 [Parcubacteria group bacterium Gr01-1014_38]|nr:MAG: hypothetical protein G01um101438_782 [Parcubacteria group bacterium Gr01-1014_38]
MGAVVVGGLFYVLGQYLASQPQRIEKEAEAKREITVHGRGEVQGKPDVARLTLGVQTNVQPSAKAALDILSRRFNDVVSALKALGIKEEDLKTTNLSITPRYDYGNAPPTIHGFEASEHVQVTIRDLDKIGEVLAKTTLEGVNQAGGITFEIDDPEALQEQAQEQAIKDAKKNAEQLAKALSVRLGRVKTFSVSSPSPGPVPIFLERAQAVGGQAPPGPPVPAGTSEIVATVTITYELR